jgi:hypothetical protein
MRKVFSFDIIESSIVQDKNHFYTFVSYFAVLVVFINLSSIESPLIGPPASVVYFLINSIFVGCAFFEKEPRFFRLVFGVLLLIMLLGFVGWLIMIIYNLDAIRLSLALAVTTTTCSLLNRRVIHEDTAT